MTYYEELGVPCDASPDEIRRAFRNTTRLLHPDLQAEPRLRHSAELQMRRLNELMATLEDPSSRSRYDQSLLGLTPARPRPSWKSRSHAALAAGLCFGVLLMLCVSFLWRDRNPEPGQSALDQQGIPAPASEEAKQRISRLPLSLQALAGKSAQLESASTDRTQSQRTIPVPVPLVSMESKGQTDRTGGSHAATDSKSPEDTQHLVEHPLIGTWLQARNAREVLAPGEYAAEFVELHLRRAGANLTGSFRSRYRITDRPIDPEVNFRFEGRFDQNEFEWLGAKGASGKVKLSLESPRSLAVEWVASDGSWPAGLNEGSAKLIRRLD